MHDRGPTPASAWRRFVEMPNERLPKLLAVVGAVCFVCSLLVSTSAVLLRPYQRANRAAERARQIEALLGDAVGLDDLVEGLGPMRIESHLVDLESGAFVEGAEPAEFDPRAASADPARSRELPAERDLAGLGRVARQAPVHLILEGDRVRRIVLPVQGEGFVSTMYGYVALEGDANTIRSLVFYEHAETPGIGAQIEDPAWLASWRGKRARDEAGELRIRVAPGPPVPGAPGAAHQVDALTGATYTSEGVTNLLRFWLGPDGFEPFLRRVAAQGDAR